MQLSTKKVMVIAALMAMSVTACTTNLSSDNYSTYGATRMQQVVPGVIVSMRYVQVANDQNAVGTLGGAALGGIAGSFLGGDSRTNAIGAVGGAVAGGLIGNQIEKGITKQTAAEYIVKVKGGSMVTVVQGPNPVFYRGQRVYVQYGSDRPRLIAAD